MTRIRREVHNMLGCAEESKDYVRLGEVILNWVRLGHGKASLIRKSNKR